MNEIPTYPKPPEPKKLTAVERSLLKPDAFAKPATLGHTKVRVRLTNEKPKGRRKKKRDRRDVEFF